MLPRKGVDEYAVERLKQDIGLLGYRRIVLMSDQEPAILALNAEVKRTSEVEIVPEMSPVGESQSNGRAERAVRTMKGQFRTMKEAIDSRYKDRIPASHAVLSWMPRHSAASVTRYQVGKDGKTAYERLKGRKFKKDVAEFGETVWFLKARSRGTTGLAGRWGEGIWLGIRGESGEAIIGTAEGIYRAMTVRRKASNHERWNRAKLDMVRTTPWNATDGTQRDDDIKVQVPGQEE